MKILENESLAKYCTFKIGGIARFLYFPEDVNDLIAIPNLKESKILGAGSNLLINDQKVFDSVVSTAMLNKRVDYLGDGTFFIGAAVRLQVAVAAINKEGFGGLEYLSSIPASIGGMVYMNAGVYSPKPTFISDFLVNVSVFIDGKIETWDKEHCLFSKRQSVFHCKSAIILGAKFKFPSQTIDVSKKRIAERLAISKNQDKSGGNCGSVFKVFDPRLMRVVKFLRLRCGGAHFSSKTANWIVNTNHASYRDVKCLMNKVVFLHKVLLKKIETEVIDWE